MKYIAKVYDSAGNLLKEFDSELVKGIAFDVASNFADECLDTLTFVRIHFDTDEEDNVNDLWCGSFDHPTRGRCKLVATEESYNREMKKLTEAADLPIYSPNELYAMPPKSVETKDVVYQMCRDWFPQRMGFFPTGQEFSDKVGAHKNIEIRYLVNATLGSDDVWVIATLWFLQMPVAVLTHHGEDGYSAYITDIDHFNQMVMWMQTLLGQKALEGVGIVDPKKPLEAYTEFWGYTIHDFYDTAAGLPKKPAKKSSWY